jgi:hypothetical protein
MIFYVGSDKERDIEDGYYWIKTKDNPYEIMRILGDTISSFDNSYIERADLTDISVINLEYRNKFVIDFIGLNSIKFSMKYGNPSPHIRHVLKGDKLVLTLDGFNPPVLAKSTDELKRLNELAVKQDNLITEQEKIINKLKLTATAKATSTNGALIIIIIVSCINIIYSLSNL